MKAKTDLRMDRPVEKAPTDNPSSRQGRVHGRGQNDHVALEDEMAHAMPQGRQASMVSFAIALSIAAALSFFAIRDIHAEDKTMNKPHFTSQAFPNNGMIPSEYTCDGANGNPPLSIRNVPAKSRSLALIVDDPDAPRGTWVHWVVWNIGPDTSEIPANSVPRGAFQGTNDFGKQSYGGPCPPSGTHRYFFKLYALNTSLALNPGATKAQLEETMKGHILEKAELLGLYRRK